MRTHKIIASLFIAGAMIALLLIANFYFTEKKMPKVHQLTAPLQFTGNSTNGPVYLLPAGTSMYFDQSFPEGFSRYIVYFNVEGIKLESKEATEKFWLDPLTAYPIDKDSLDQLLKSGQMTKEQLRSILKYGSLSKQDIRELLEEFSK